MNSYMLQLHFLIDRRFVLSQLSPLFWHTESILATKNWQLFKSQNNLAKIRKIIKDVLTTEFPFSFGMLIAHVHDKQIAASTAASK